MRPGDLLGGKIGYGVEADASSGFLKTNLALGAGGSAALSDLTASITLASLQDFVNMPGLDGSLSIRFDRLQLENGLPVAADGTIEVANLTAPLVHRSPIGGFRAEFFTQDTGVVASVEDTDASIDLAGSLKITTDRNYQFLGKVAPKDNTPARLQEQMKFLAVPTSAVSSIFVSRTVIGFRDLSPRTPAAVESTTRIAVRPRQSFLYNAAYFAS